jgi:hypothetical protein
MEDIFAAFHAALERLHIAQIADDPLRREIVDIVGAAGRPHKQAQLGTMLQQLPRDVTSEETRRSCDKTPHPILCWRQSPDVFSACYGTTDLVA